MLFSCTGLQAWALFASCNPCAKLEEVDLQFGPDLDDWITNAAVLGADLRQKLRFIRDNRLPGKQFYVSLSSAVGNPSFDRELSYPTLKLPDSGFQLLSLYRFWNIIEYWSPNRNVLGQDWNGVLAQFIPRIAMAKERRFLQSGTASTDRQGSRWPLQLAGLAPRVEASHW